MNSWNQLQVGLPHYQGVAIYPAGATFGPRQMRDWEFVWVLEGDAEYFRRDQSGETRVAAPAGSLVLCRPDATDGFIWDENRRTRHAYFHFQIESWPNSWPDCALWPLVALPRNDDLLRPLFRQLLHDAQEPGNESSTRNAEMRALELRLTIAHLLTRFVAGDLDCAREPTPETWPRAVEDAWKHIHQRLEEAPDAAISLRELARAAHATPEHFCRVWKAATGWTPMQAVRLARLDKAAVLLARSNYNIGEIARMCGFASAFHFSRVFKEAFAQTPRELRNALRNGATPPVPRLLRHLV